MAGRYVGQINARIDRAWMRPRTAIGAPIFACRVRIDQDRAGNVLDVTLERCNGDAHWQLSLVEAIESASPLPAPPDPGVFAPIVHMSFHATAYRSGAPEGEYEPKGVARVAQADASDDNAESALDRLHEALLKAHPNEVIELTIKGSASRSPLGGPPPAIASPEEIPRDSGPR
ncbi:MAG: TonB C-terminal domain-containing protein [Steroidobacteraceae bacterium]